MRLLRLCTPIDQAGGRDGTAGVTHDGPEPQQPRPVVVTQLQAAPLRRKPVGAAALPVWLAWKPMVAEAPGARTPL